MVHVGIGYDVHPLVEGRRLVLGGVEIPHPKGLEGHSDADALMHALMPQSTLTIIPGAAHLPPLERPAETADALRRWLDQPQ